MDMDEEGTELIKGRLLSILRNINLSARYVFATPPDAESDKWRCGWVDDPMKPKVCFFDQDVDPKKLIRRINKHVRKK